MKQAFLFPSDYFEKSKPDELFAEQFTAFKTAGYPVFTFEQEDFETSKIRPAANSVSFLYRCFMLSAIDYQRLDSLIRRTGCTPFTSVEEYLQTHHIPNWYPLLKDLTPETEIIVDLNAAEARLRSLKWDRFFVKDFVKSLKTAQGSLIDDPAKIGPLMAEMAKFRGSIEGGLCVRRYEDFQQGSELRYFVLQGKAFAPGSESIPDIVAKVVERIPSPFFSIDIALNAAGEQRVVEIGDGQVSDLVGWKPADFVRIFE